MPDEPHRGRSCRALGLVLATGLLSACGLDAIVHVEEPGPCICPNADDVCRDGTCVQREGSCTPTSGCASPYLCDLDVDRCSCDPTPDAWDACAPRCDEVTPCPDGLLCDEDIGVCIPPMQCRSDAVCAEGEACAEGGVVRSVVWDGNAGYFVSTFGAQTCQAGARSTTTGCGTGEDCEAGDCVISYSGSGECEDPGVCGPDEFRDGGPTATCYIHQTCRYDADCPETYRCRVLPLDAESSGYCGRTA